MFNHTTMKLQFVIHTYIHIYIHKFIPAVMENNQQINCCSLFWHLQHEKSGPSPQQHVITFFIC